MASRQGRRFDSGVTLIELIVVMTLIGIVSATTVWGLRQYQRSQALKGTANNVVAALRNAAERAQSEGRTYCVDIATGGKSWSLWRSTCPPGPASNSDPATQVGSNTQVQDSGVTIGVTSLDADSHGNTCGGALGCVFFYPRGNATGGTLTISRGTTTYTVKIEGLTSRVYLA